MPTKRFRLIAFLLFLLIGEAPLQAVKGVPLATFDFQFSTPFVLIAEDDINSTAEDSPVYGDKILTEVTFPFYLGLNLGYILSLNKQHSILGNWSIRYSDDPINFIFDSETSSKLGAPSFTSKNINTSVLLKYIWREVTPILDFSPSISATYNLTKNNSFDFDNNIYNFHSYSFNTSFKFNNLNRVDPSLNGMGFIFNLGYVFNYYPLGNEAARTASDGVSIYPSSSKNYHNIHSHLKYIYWFAPNMGLSLKYKVGVDIYVNQPIHNGSLESPEFTDVNELTLRHYLNLDFYFSFIKEDGDYFWNLVTSYFFRLYDSNYVELLTFTETERGDLGEYLANAEFVGSELVFYQDDYKDYMVNLGSLYNKFNFNKNHKLTLGYTFLSKYFFEVYAKYGKGAPYTYGAFKGDKRFDLSHIISLGYIWGNDQGNRFVNPFLGIIFSESNDQTVNLNRHIYFVGIKGTYEI